MSGFPPTPVSPSSPSQVVPAAATLTTLYTCPANRVTQISVTMCETNGVATAVRVSVQVAAEADAIKQYLLRDCPIGANETISIEGINLNATDVLKGYSTSGNVSFSLFPSVTTPTTL